MCRFFEVSRSGYYDYLHRKDIPDRDLPLANLIKECQEQNHRTYGYRRVQIWLERQGIYRNPKTVLRVMQKYNLLSVVRRKKFHYCSQYLHRYPNMLNRDFTAERPNQIYRTSKQDRDSFTFQSSEICTTTALFRTKHQKNNQSN